MLRQRSAREARVKTKEKFASMSPSKFFYEHRELAGFEKPSKALYQTVRELVENALDATDEHGIKPDIVVTIQRVDESRDKYMVSVLDNGIGISPDEVPYAFARVLYSSKYRLRQSRGRFGLGVKMVVLYAQTTTGEPVEVFTSPIGSKRIYYYRLKIDVETNQPIVLGKGSWTKTSDWHGTLVKIIIHGDWQHIASKIKEYIRRTAVITPYACIVFIAPDGSVTIYPRVIDKVPPGPKEVKPHPHGVDIELLKYLIKQSKARTLREFLVETFQGVGRVTAEKFLKESGFDPNMDPRKMNVKMLEKLSRALREYKGFRGPSGSALSPLGEDIITAGLRAIFSPEFVTAITRKPKAYSGHPFIVEVGIAYGGAIKPSEEPIVLRYANKIPLLYEEKADVVWKVVSEDIDWRQYLVSFPAPLVVLTHICSTKIPYKSAGKEYVAEVPEIRAELKHALREAARRLRAYLLEKRREQEMRRRLVTFLKYIPEVSRSLAVIAGSDDGISEEKIREKLVECIVRKLGIPQERVAKMISSYRVEIEE